jgi:hypothetical protein
MEEQMLVIIDDNQDFHEIIVPFLCGNWEMESNVQRKSMVLGLRSKIVANSIDNILEQYPGSKLDESTETLEQLIKSSNQGFFV